MHYMSASPTPNSRTSQLLKGVLDLCILALLRDGPLYGYAVVDALSGRGIDLVAEGTIYPLLTRMEKAGVLSSYRAPSPEGPPRKYYKITPLGEEELITGVNQWEGLNLQIGALFAQSESRATTKEARNAASK